MAQAKLKMGAPNDGFEQEADRVADRVMRLPEPRALTGTAISGLASPARVQRMCRECADELRHPSGDTSRLCPECEEELRRQPISQAAVPMIQKASALEDEALCEGVEFPPASVWFLDPLLVRIRLDEKLMAFGSVGEPVALVQQAVAAWGCENGLGHLLPKFGVDGIFGSETRGAVKTFQAHQRIADDGIVGPITMGEMDRVAFGGVLQCPSGTTKTALVAASQPGTLRNVCIPLQVPPAKGCPTPATSGHTGTHAPLDNFSGRSLSRYGVGERVNLGFGSSNPEVNKLPAAKRAEFFGGGRWVKISGLGSVTVTSADLRAGTAIYTADHNAGSVELELQVAVGPCQGSAVAQVQFDIVRPNELFVGDVTLAPNFGGLGFPTIQPLTWGAGFLGQFFVAPTDVSFRGVMFREGGGTSVVTPAGSFLKDHHGNVHPTGPAAPGGKPDINKGTHVDSPGDQNVITEPVSFAGQGPTCGVSKFKWPIDQEFSVGGSSFSKYDVATQQAESTTSCNATIEKAGAGSFCRTIFDKPC